LHTWVQINQVKKTSTVIWTIYHFIHQYQQQYPLLKKK
jgi:hypothetical protein